MNYVGIDLGTSNSSLSYFDDETISHNCRRQSSLTDDNLGFKTSSPTR